jgi:hypothetical protein
MTVAERWTSVSEEHRRREREKRLTLRGDFSDDLRMMVLPAATEGPSLLQSMRDGTLKGSCRKKTIGQSPRSGNEREGRGSRRERKEQTHDSSGNAVRLTESHTDGTGSENARLAESAAGEVGRHAKTLASVATE